MPKQLWWAGQKVFAYGYGIGTVQVIEVGTYPLVVLFNSGIVKHFTLDGRYDVDQTSPVLFPFDGEVPRLTIKVKMLLDGWFNVYKDQQGRPVVSAYKHESKDAALNSRYSHMKYCGDPVHIVHEWKE